MSLLESLIVASEKAANIARICRQEECLFNLLIQEKNSDEANPRFVQDFKTLADVLIQETVKHDIGKQVSEYCLITDYVIFYILSCFPFKYNRETIQHLLRYFNRQIKY